jgi:hypothetical protein
MCDGRGQEQRARHEKKRPCHDAGVRLPNIALCVILTALATPALAQTPATHDKAWWQAVAAAKFEVPPGTPLPALLDELTGLLGHQDPELRDDIAYTTLAQWLYVKRAVPEAERLRLMRVWQANLRAGLGEQGTPTVLRRSFSALALAILPGLDNEAPFLDRDAFASILTSTITYLREERDVRGFDNTLGWMHSVAHTADVLRFLGRSRHLTVAEQGLILTAISDKLSAVTTPLTHGEDERLARAVLSLAARPDFDEAAFAAFLKALTVRPAGPPTEASLALGQNRRHLLTALLAVMSTDPRDLATLTKAKTMVVGAVRGG